MKISLQIWDLAGSSHGSIRPSFYKGMSSAVLIFDLSDKEALNNLDFWFQELWDNKGAMTSIVLVGNKHDLSVEVDETKIPRIIEKWEVKFGWKIPYVKSSAKLGTTIVNGNTESIDWIFNTSTQNILHRTDKDNFPNQDSIFFKLILVGDPTVGKTSIKRRYMGQEFTQDHLMTIGADFSVKTMDINEIDNTTKLTIDDGIGGSLGRFDKILELDKRKSNRFLEYETLDQRKETSEVEGSMEKLADKQTTTTKNIDVEYYDRMNPNKHYRLSINFTSAEIEDKKQETTLLTGERKVQVKTDLGVSTEKSPFVTVEPFFPGCLVYPEKQVVDYRMENTELEFFVTPLVFGEINEARILFSHNDAIVLRIGTPTKVINPRTAQIIAVGGSIGALTPKIVAFGLDISNLPRLLIFGTSVDLLFFLSLPGILISLFVSLWYRRKNKPKTSQVEHLGKELDGVAAG